MQSMLQNQELEDYFTAQSVLKKLFTEGVCPKGSKPALRHWPGLYTSCLAVSQAGIS